MENTENTQMTLEEFTIEFETLMDNDEEKAATILAQCEPELYARYWVEVCGEELEEAEV
jgi:hypothetical protein